MAGDRLSPSAAAALENLCRAYWYPLYAHIRRKGISPTDAQDITQEFFCRLIAKNYLEAVDRSRGSFRSFLLASINHLLADEWSKARALKRGGDRQIVSLNSAEAERRFTQEPKSSESPDTSFDRQWAVTLLSRAMSKLRLEFEGAGKLQQFDTLKCFLSEVAGDGDYAALAQLLGCEPGAVAVAVHRLRVRYRGIVQAEIAQTVTTESELRAEMRHLFASVG
jgi:RNA polymerase sigma-70 factor (ECF subfamily)